MLKVLRVLAVGAVLGAALAMALPEFPRSVVDFWASRTGLNMAAIGKLGWALVLIRGATKSRSPTGLRILGGLSLLSGVGLAFLSTEDWTHLIRWMLVDHLALYRFVACPFGILLGAYLWYAAGPQRATETRA